MINDSVRRRDILLAIGLVALTLLIYWQVKDFKLVYYDDSAYVNERPHVMAGLTWDGVKWAMTSTEAGFWHPLTWLSLMADRELFGNHPGGYHWTNVIIHILNILLLFSLLKEATTAPYRSAFVALIFAVHPLHVESVAWVAQRKDILCTLFGFASLFAYVRYAGALNRRWYISVVALFVLGLMSKPMIVTFPFVMLLLDFWPLRRFVSAGDVAEGSPTPPIPQRTCKALIAEKIPMVLLSVFASVLVIITEQKAKALTGLEVLSVMERLANAFVSYVKYIAMAIWPANLTFLYLHPVTTPLPQAVGALLLLLAITGLVLIMRRKAPYLFTGWFWYIGTLIPVIGLIQVGPHALADRYTYVPLIGLSIIGVWGLADMAVHWRRGRIGLWIIGSVVVAGLTYSAWVQIGYWRNSITLFERALKIAPDNYIVLNNLGSFYVGRNEFGRGMHYIERAIAVKPTFGPLYYNMGLAWHHQHQYEKAIDYFLKAENLSFKDNENRRLLGDSYRLTRQWTEAIAAYQRALEVNGRDMSSRYGLALTFHAAGRQDMAIRELRAILSLESHNLNARKLLMALLLDKGDKDGVVAEGQKALENGTADPEVRQIMEAAQNGPGRDRK